MYPGTAAVASTHNTAATDHSQFNPHRHATKPHTTAGAWYCAMPRNVKSPSRKSTRYPLHAGHAGNPCCMRRVIAMRCPMFNNHPTTGMNISSAPHNTSRRASDDCSGNMNAERIESGVERSIGFTRRSPSIHVRRRRLVSDRAIRAEASALPRRSRPRARHRPGEDPRRRAVSGRRPRARARLRSSSPSTGCDGSDRTPFDTAHR